MEQFINKVLLGDCRQELKKLPDNSVDSVVCDPPAGISFMGKEWDTFDHDMFGKEGEEGENDLKVKKNFKVLPRYGNADLFGFQNFICEVFIEVYRVLKPGGHCLVWAIPKTSHHTAMGLERAGFEIRDKIVHVFGCLSDDTEILTVNGWEHYHKDVDKSLVFCYNIDKDDFEFCQPIRSFCYANTYPAYRIQSDRTDQIVSRNHRVPVEREGKLLFQYAEEMAQEQKENVPFLESLPDLLQYLPNSNSRTGKKKQSLPSLQGESNKSVKYRETSKTPVTCLQNLWNSIQSKGSYQKTKNLFVQMYGNVEKKKWPLFIRKDEKDRGIGKKWMDGIVTKKLFSKNVWSKQSCVEGWGYLFQNTWELCWGKIYSLSNRIFDYGSERWLCYGTQNIGGTTNWQTTFENRSSTSFRPQPCQQFFRKFNSFFFKQRSQTTRREKRYKTTLATITEIEYKGNVWCVEVPTGCFVARRNGKIFITGNSGFPKSMSIGKAVDKVQGNEREVVGLKHPQYPNGIPGGKGFHNSLGREGGERVTPEMATKGNSEWEGWGTALKPSHEDWILCRKPIEEDTIVDNVLKYGTGGINIDECRIGYQNEKDKEGARFGTQTDIRGNAYGTNKPSQGNVLAKNVLSSEQGRFPSNLILQCTCDEVIQGSPLTSKPPEEVKGGIFSPSEGKPAGNTYSGGGGIHTNPDCPCYKLDQQSGLECGQLAPTNGNEPSTQVLGKTYGDYRGQGKPSEPKDSLGGASRFFYQAKAPGNQKYFYCEDCKDAYHSDYIDKHKGHKIVWHPTVKSEYLMQYLIKLITPEGGIVLDCFAGTGTTLISARKLFFKFIGIEQDETYYKIIQRKLEDTRTLFD